MSLNISVATRSAIHQSADFCITEFIQRGSIWVPRTIAPAPKVTVLQYMGWRAVITYVGIAKLDGLSTADWLTRELTHPIGQRTAEEVVEHIRSKASRFPQESYLHHGGAGRWSAAATNPDFKL